MDIAKDIQKILTDKSVTVSSEWFAEAKEKYPYFTLPALLYLHRNKDEDGINEEILGRLAISSPDRKALYALLGENALRFASFYPPEPLSPQPDTDSTLDTFLATYGKTDDKELELLDKMIFNPVPDYAQLLAAEEERSKPPKDISALNDEDALINSFILKSKEKPGYFPTENTAEKENVEPEVKNEPIDAPIATDDSMLSESLAKIYIKQRKYLKALEIIESISLKFPEKSIYFADQIRFLRKLIKIETIKNNK